MKDFSKRCKVKEAAAIHIIKLCSHNTFLSEWRILCLKRGRMRILGVGWHVIDK